MNIPIPSDEFGKIHRIVFVGGTDAHRASITRAASVVDLHIEPVAAVDELGTGELNRADVFLVWHDGATILELVRRQSEVGCWSPIVAISAAPTPRQIVDAMRAGATDFVEWPCDGASLSDAVLTAYEASVQLLPDRTRQFAARCQLERLTLREREVLEALVRGMANKEIARELCISPRTVEVHRANLMGKLDANHSADLIRLALEASLLVRPPFRSVGGTAEPVSPAVTPSDPSAIAVTLTASDSMPQSLGEDEAPFGSQRRSAR